MNTLRKSLISIFILLNILIMVRVHMPLKVNFFSALYRPIDTYLSFFSIYQDWLMFAPNPDRLNVYLTAKVEFDDGSTQDYEFPNSMKMGYLEKYISGEKFRKLLSESLRKDSSTFMWDDASRFVLRKVKDESFNKIPLKVDLIRNFELIPDVDKEFRAHAEAPKKYESVVFYTYEVLK